MGRHFHVQKEQLDLFEGGGPRGLVPNADVCTSRHRGAPTSVEAFQTTPQKFRDRQREKVLAFIKGRGSQGATCEEASIALGIAYTAASARFTELKRLCLLTDSGQRRPTTHGKTAGVFLADNA